MPEADAKLEAEPLATGKDEAAANTPKSAIVTSLLLDENEKPMPVTSVVFMEAGGTFSKAKVRGQIASGLTDDMGFVHTFDAPPDRPWEIVVVRDGEEIMRSTSITTPVPANSRIGAPNYFLELRAGSGSKVDVLLTPLSPEANQATPGAHSDEVFAYRLAMATLLQKLNDLPAKSDEKGVAFLPVSGAIVPVTKRAELAGQIDRLRRLIRSGGDVGVKSLEAHPKGTPIERQPMPTPATKLHRREVRQKNPDGEDLVMTFDELRRDEKTSTATAKSVGGGSVGSAMFVMRGAYDIAQARGAAYFVNLKEWDGENGARMYLIGFSQDKDVNPQEYFGLKEPLPDDGKHLFFPVKAYERIFQDQP